MLSCHMQVNKICRITRQNSHKYKQITAVISAQDFLNQEMTLSVTFCVQSDRLQVSFVILLFMQMCEKKAFIQLPLTERMTINDIQDI